MSENVHEIVNEDNIVNDVINPIVDPSGQVVKDPKVMKQVIEYLQKPFKMVGFGHAPDAHDVQGVGFLDKRQHHSDNLDLPGDNDNPQLSRS